MLTFLSVVFFGKYNYNKGYEQAEDDIAREVNEKIERERKRYQKAQNELYEVERAWLEEEVEKEIVYRTRYKEVVNNVKEYVEVNNLGDCGIDDERVQDVNRIIQGASSESK